ncbi:response regulator transcription factor [Ureibacillus sinduriensis]|uniref:Nitrate/nitrite response regulator protein narL n=1 Tax=Ureibacillus sinduriensis BLB-1 = JCM 15800 TaxID=1384057 RepID=A0A0A3HRM4_9BACL|nr:response regulator transcription factor [Ureibacillus sinduriensis]KGR73835.1 nitrate/nitrite response regulator protein narL [Ureibacillus sinduriensis BLB-1 = JCM 15800]
MKVVIIDNHALIRKGLQFIFSTVGTIQVTGEATNSQEALHLLNKVQPDIAIIDLQLGDEHGLNIIKEAHRLGVACKFAILASSMTEEDFQRAKDMNVDGFLSKEALAEELIYGLNVIAKGRKYYDPTILDGVMNSNSLHEYEEQLTPKEIEVLIELGKGLSNKEISNALYITEYTVKKHVSQIFSKLGLSDRTQAALYANAKGLVTYVVTH